MRDSKFTAFLDKNFDRVLPEYREKYLNHFSELGFDKKNADFIDFWSNFNDEFSIKDGFLPPFCYEIIDFENSVTSTLRKNIDISDNLYSLFNFEFDDYMFYDKNTDEVLFILSPNLKSFLDDNTNCDKRWDSFIEFLKYQLDYKE